MHLQAGSQAPPLTGTRDVLGNAVSLDTGAGTHVLLVFLRYASCPMCLLHVRELQQRYAELRRAAMRFGFWGGAIDGEAARMPADFLISSDGTVCAAHYGRTIGDHLSLDEVLRLSGAESPALTGVA